MEDFAQDIDKRAHKAFKKVKNDVNNLKKELKTYSCEELKQEFRELRETSKKEKEELQEEINKLKQLLSQIVNEETKQELNEKEKYVSYEEKESKHSQKKGFFRWLVRHEEKTDDIEEVK